MSVWFKWRSLTLLETSSCYKQMEAKQRHRWKMRRAIKHPNAYLLPWTMRSLDVAWCERIQARVTHLQLLREKAHFHFCANKRDSIRTSLSSNYRKQIVSPRPCTGVVQETHSSGAFNNTSLTLRTHETPPQILLKSAIVPPVECRTLHEAARLVNNTEPVRGRELSEPWRGLALPTRACEW